MPGDSPHAAFLTEQGARDLLHRTRQLRKEWAQFALHSKVHFDALRDLGASFPKSFLQAYAELEQRKADLAATVVSQTASIDREIWTPPVADDSLHEFESTLEDLVQVCRELERVVAEKRNRFLRVLTTIRDLTFVDHPTSLEFAATRQSAEQLLHTIQEQPFRVADVQLETQIDAMESLLRLIDDAQHSSDSPRNNLQEGSSPVTDAATRSQMTAADCERLFEIVSQQFGRRVAIESLRKGRIAGPSADTSHQTGQSAGNAESIQGQVASRESIASLIQHFNARPTSAPASVRRTTVSRAASLAGIPNPISMQQLAQAAEDLRKRAARLAPDTGDSEPSDEQRQRDSIRSLGFRNLAHAIELTGELLAYRGDNVRSFRNELQQLLRLLAEAQNAVRVEWEESYGRGAPLPEQAAVFYWLRHTSSEDAEAIRIDRYMRIEERADPSRNSDLTRRLEQFQQHFRELVKRDQHLQSLAGCVQAISRTAAGDQASLGRLWSEVDTHVSALLQLHVRANDAQLRELLLPVADTWPDVADNLADEGDETQLSDSEVSEELTQVLEALREYLQSRSSDEPELTVEQSSPEVLAARRLLQGKLVTVVGGVCKPHAAARLRHHLHLRDLRWLAASKRQRVSDLEPQVRDASLVILITKLMGHKHNDVREMCRRYGIPCVNMKVNAGYSVNQIAASVMEQVSDQLDPDD